uniref:WD repeat and HMG-box DNA-binding protein 1 n=1 Tax=Aceria tosichella TaxID=561515 RepID=A0A6G1SGF6_9ACAR
MEDEGSLSRIPSPEDLVTEGNNINDLLDELEDSIDDVGQIKKQFMSRIMPEDEEFNSSQVPVDTITKREVQDLIDSVPKPMVQKPIQPGSSPADEENRFLCWNNIGIIRAQNGQEDQSIDVMFHDTEKHSSVNFKNEPNYIFGSLSEECIVVASNGKYGTGPSSIHGINLLESNRDQREWEIEMPHVELIEALAAGSGFVAIVTDQRNLRLFTNAGMQSFMFTLPGQVLCMAAQDHQLMIIYHDGAGHSDDQNLSMFVYHIDIFNNIFKQTYKHIPVALSKRSPLAWAGFSDEGTPCTYDYSGMFRIYSHRLGGAWIPLLDLRNLTSSALDHYFVVGASELSQVVKAVKCRRSRFPQFQTETAQLLNFSLPMCDMDSNKGKLEEEHIRLRLAEQSYQRISHDTNYFSMAEAALNANEKLLVNAILRLFALYLKEHKEDAAKNLIYMIPKEHMSKLAEFAWKIKQPQYFIDSLNQAIEEREQLDLEMIKAVATDDDDAVSVVSSHHNFGKDLRRELNSKNNNNDYDHTGSERLKPLPLDKLATKNVNRIVDSGEIKSSSNKRALPTTDADESGDENDAKRAKKTKSINYNLFSKKRPVDTLN